MRTQPIIRTLSSLLLLPLLIGACSGAGPAATTTPVAPGTSPASVGGGATGLPDGGATTGPAASGPVRGHVGDKLQWSIDGTPYAATLVKVFDPATATGSSDAPQAGTHWVGAEMTLSDAQGNPADDSGALDGTGSDGQRYGAAGSPNSGYHLGTHGASGEVFQGCTAVPGGEGGQLGTICSAFLVPDGVTVMSVGYGVEGVDVGGPDDAIWSIP